jgi:hypothetical protein
MLITYVQASPNSRNDIDDDSREYHIQATGPAFPLGYASGDVELSITPRVSFIESMRGSGRLYFALTEEEIDENLVDLVCSLNAPYPAYSPSDAEAVARRVRAAIAQAEEGPPKPAPAQSGTGTVDEQMIARIVAAVIAALKQ